MKAAVALPALAVALPLLTGLFTAQNASAALITYDIAFNAAEFQDEDPVPDLYPGTGQAIFDSQARSLVGLTLDSDVYSFDWAGMQPLEYTVMEFSDSGNYYFPTVSVEAGAATVLFDLDLIVADSETELFYNFSHGEHEIEWSEGEQSFWGYASLVRIPEPASIMLFGVGLVGIALGRRRS